MVEDDWTSVIDDIDRYGLSDNALPLRPLSQVHRTDPSSGQAAFTDSGEDSKQERMKFVVHMVPAFGLKELSVYADPDQLI